MVKVPVFASISIPRHVIFVCGFSTFLKFTGNPNVSNRFISVEKALLASEGGDPNYVIQIINTKMTLRPH